ncbi:sodium-dependent noradrenaline transporter-like [Gordionus sp. m RMFG-2023]|uniref:sodium-dependent noradrenaline transporter-like n=1 Tax=Gordionus sp. m RMFG-2023 TaxID=3053472 RepID=UPI0031FC4044
MNDQINPGVKSERKIDLYKRYGINHAIQESQPLNNSIDDSPWDKTIINGGAKDAAGNHHPNNQSPNDLKGSDLQHKRIQPYPDISDKNFDHVFVIKNKRAKSLGDKCSMDTLENFGSGRRNHQNKLILLPDRRYKSLCNANTLQKFGFEDEEQQEEREEWSSKADFLLSIIGFAVDLSNIWRFPYLCYKNGGGAFLIPYTIMLIFGGVPLLYMELALGQYNRAGAVGIWKMVPFLKGTGYAAILMTFYVSFYYPVICGYAFYYLFASFKSKLPWITCDNSWNTPACVEHRTRNMSLKPSHIAPIHGLKTASEEYFERKVLGIQDGSGFQHFTPIKWDVCLCALLVYLIVFLSLFRGVKTSGKVVWFTAIAPYILLTILLIQALLLPGSLNGIIYYLTPQMHKLKSAQVWYEAAVQIFYSTGPGFGVHIAYASYNKFHNNIQTDVIVTSAVNSLTSFFAGFVVFAFLGYMSMQRGLEIDRVAKDGPGLVFIVYPEALAILKGSVFFSIIFFLTLLTLGLDSLLGGMEAVITGLLDDLGPTLKSFGISKKVLIGIVIFTSFCVALLCTTKDGIYWITFLDTYAAGTALLFIVFFEAVGVAWIYGVDRFSSNIEEMIGFRPNIYWRWCWKYISPTLIMAMITAGFLLNEPLRYGNYIYPKWANGFGWSMVASSILLIPFYAIWYLRRTKAKNLYQRLQLCVKSSTIRKHSYYRTLGSSVIN